MSSITDLMGGDHRHCDDLFAAVEQAVAAQAWDRANAAFACFQGAMQQHFAAEEEILFPTFEAKTGMPMGPTQVMRDEHVLMKGLLASAQDALLAKDADDYSGNAETLLVMMQQHNMKEENVLYPMCDEHLRKEADALLQHLQQQIRKSGRSIP